MKVKETLSKNFDIIIAVPVIYAISLILLPINPLFSLGVAIGLSLLAKSEWGRKPFYKKVEA